MKIVFYAMGKPHDNYVKAGIEEFTKRLQHYFPTEWNIVPSPKNAALLNIELLKKKEAETITKLKQPGDKWILLDETGKEISSVQLAEKMEQLAQQNCKRLVFLIGSAYGVHNSIKQNVDGVWSLSKLVFPHMLARLIVAEQVYRACTIIKKEAYHHS